MGFLLRVSRAIDGLNERIGRLTVWLVLVVTLLSAANAVMRYAFSYSSNAYLEAQWYLYSLIFLLGGAYVLKHNAHVRIDLVSGRFPQKVRAWIDVAGHLLFLIPLALGLLYLSWPWAMNALAVREVSPDAGGLPRWPIKLVLPLGFALLLLQGISETIKKIAYLMGYLELQEEAGEVVK